MKVVLLGSGNVATQLGKALKNEGHEIAQVWSRNASHAKKLASSLSTVSTSLLSDLDSFADVYILSVSDDAIEEVSSSFPFKNKLLVHTSGSADLNLANISGVFYPLQTFSKLKNVDFKDVPIFLESNNVNGMRALKLLADSLSTKVYEIKSNQRKALHVAAVFACNFSNHLYAVANEILKNNDLNFELLKPLILETAEKIQSHSPQLVQTGPAVRNDQTTLNKHLEFLESYPQFKEIYKGLSQSIINLNQKA